MQRLVIAARDTTGRCAPRLQIDLPVIAVQLASEEVELWSRYKRLVYVFRATVLPHSPSVVGEVRRQGVGKIRRIVTHACPKC